MSDEVKFRLFYIACGIITLVWQVWAMRKPDSELRRRWIAWANAARYFWVAILAMVIGTLLGWPAILFRILIWGVPHDENS